MTRNRVFDCLCKTIQQSLSDDIMVIGLEEIKNFLTFGALMARKEANNNKYMIKLKQKNVLKNMKKLKETQNSESSGLALKMWKKYLKGNILRKKLRLKRAIVCFGNERHSLYGLFQNKKKRLSV